MSDMNLVDIKRGIDREKEPIKAGFGRGLVEAGKQNNQVVALSSDVTGSTGAKVFADEFPDRFVQVGVAEQNLVTVASGMAAEGKIPFAAAYAAFSPGRNWEQIRTTIALNDMPVKLVSTHVGLSDAPDGATHQMLEDLALMRTMPNMVVIAPCDSIEAEKATIAVAGTKEPSYLRIARDDTPIITTNDTPFEIGKAYIFAPGSDLTIISTGRMTYLAILAAEMMYKDGIDAEVIHVPTIKPLDAVTILKSVKKTKKVITVEEHQAVGGLGGAISEFLGEHCPVPIRRIGIKDQFGESGKPEQLMNHFGLTDKNIVVVAHELMNHGENNG